MKNRAVKKIKPERVEGHKGTSLDRDCPQMALLGTEAFPLHFPWKDFPSNNKVELETKPGRNKE